MRAQARQNTFDQQAAELAARGQFHAAVRAQDKGQSAFSGIMNRAAAREKAGDFGFAGRQAGNVGEALSGIRDKIGGREMLDRMREADGFDRSKGERANMENAFLKGKFDDVMSDKGKTPEERKAEEQQSQGGGGGGGGSDAPQGGIESIVSDIAATVKSIDKKLPQNALAA